MPMKTYLSNDLVMGSGELGTTSELGIARVGHNILDDGPKHGKHGNTAMLDLSLLEELDVTDGGKAKRIEPSITRERFIKVCRLLQERNRRGHLHLGANRRCSKDRLISIFSQKQEACEEKDVSIMWFRLL